MNLKSILIWCGKAILGGVLATAVLTCFCRFYYYIPVPYSNQYGTTDFLWTPDTVYLQAKEGFGWGRANNEGFFESADYQGDMPVDVLIMGGSYVEGYQVPQSETMTEILGDLMPDKTVYSVGMTNHIFLTCCDNLEAALNYYKPAEAVAIEVNRIDFSADELLSVAEGTFPELSRGSSGRISRFLACNPFLRLTHKQLTEYFGLMEEKKAGFSGAEDHAVTEFTRYQKALNDLFEKLSDLCKQHETDLILFYHPETQLDHDGALLFDTNPDALRVFRGGCERHGITFADMTDPFARLYEEEHRLPYGFINTQAGKGHFNAAGHRLVAEELCASIRSLEAERE